MQGKPKRGTGQPAGPFSVQSLPPAYARIRNSALFLHPMAAFSGVLKGRGPVSPAPPSEAGRREGANGMSNLHGSTPPSHHLDTEPTPPQRLQLSVSSSQWLDRGPSLAAIGPEQPKPRGVAWTMSLSATTGRIGPCPSGICVNVGADVPDP